MLKAWTRLGRARILGVKLYFHWSVVAGAALFAVLSFRSPIWAVVAIACYLGVILIHECGHAWVARRLGYEVEAIRVALFHGR